MTINAKKLLISENSKISFVGGNSQLEFVSGSFENNSQISANGGNITLKSSQNINLNNLSLLSENGVLTLDANLTLSNGNYISILDNVVVKAGHTITVANGSSVKINANSTVTYENGASIVLQNGAFLEIDGVVPISVLKNLNFVMEAGSFYKLNDFAELNINEAFVTSNDFSLGNAAKIIVQNNPIGFGAAGINFTSSGPNKWRGIYVHASQLSLYDCTVDNAQIGVYVASQNTNFTWVTLDEINISNCSFGVVARANETNSVDLTHCDIHNNSYGVYSDLNGHVNIFQSTINSNNTGIYGGPRGNFTVVKSFIFDNADYGVNLGNYAHGFFGSADEFGENTFYNNATYDIYNQATSKPIEILAQRNHWTSPSSWPPGDCSINGNNCYDVNLASIYGCNPVKVTPNYDCPWLDPSPLSQEQQDFAFCFELEIDGNYAQAETDFHNFLINYPNSNYWSTALGGVVRNKEIQGNASQVTSYLENLILNELGEHRDRAKELLLIQYVKENRFGEATAVSQELITTYANTENELMALLEEDFLQYFQGGSTKINSDKSISKNYPDTPEAFLSQLLSEKQELKNISQNVLPTNFNLRQNYPNPFNPTTTIEFSLPTNAKVELKIFNTLGQKVQTLVSKNFEAGTHNVVWNGTDETGKQVSSGIYFYQLKTENFSETKKMVLLK
ncbi:T9SS type A sorting domain-containing protein, partial [bacterium]|nr:T9SS type A sorting domain-containing protein [bacterium]